MDAISLASDEGGLEEDLGGAEALGSEDDYVPVGELVALLKGR